MTSTASSLEVKRWLNKNMISEDFPVYAVVEDEYGYITERYRIYGCSSNGEYLKLKISKF